MQLYTISGRSQSSSKLLAAILVALLTLTPAAPVFAAYGDGTPTIPNANVFTNSALPKIDGATGAFTQSITLDIPPGRSGLQPNLSLDYNSQRTKDSIVGYGWQISIPYIERLNKTGSQDLYGDSPSFSSSLDGELTPATSSTIVSVATSAPSIIATSTDRAPGQSTGDSFSFDAGATTTNAVLVFLFTDPGGGAPNSATYNGKALIIRPYTGAYYNAWGYIVNPSPGVHTFSISYQNQSAPQYRVLLVKNVDQVTPYDADGDIWGYPTKTCPLSLTLSSTTDLIVGEVAGNSQAAPIVEGPGQTELWQTEPYGSSNIWWAGSMKSPTTTGTQTFSATLNTSSTGCDTMAVALKQATSLITKIAASSTPYLARVDNGSHNAYSFSNNTWTVYDRKGTRYLFGATDVGRQYDTSTGTSTNTYRWYLQEIRDTNGNYVKYTYAKDSNEIYPSQIIYTGNGSSDGPATISFATSTRPDIRINDSPDFKVATNYRISEIDASFNSQLVRKNLLSYGSGNNGVRSLLTSVQAQGYDDNNNLTSLPATTFTYANSPTQFYTPSAGTQVSNQAYQIADVNGNGINDITELDYNGTSAGGSIYADQKSSIGSLTPPDFWASAGSPPTPIERGTRFIDINGDGKADIVRGLRDNVHSTSTFALYLNTYATSTHTYTWTATSTWVGFVPPFAFLEPTMYVSGGVFGDVNGDGLPDYVESLPSWQMPMAYLGNGTGWNAYSSVFVSPQDFPTTAPTATSSQLADINGDGLDDWIYSNGTSTYVLLNTGSGWDATPSSQWTIATSTLFKSPDAGTTYYDRGIRFMDINGDGLPDFVRSYSGPCSLGTKTAPTPECGAYSVVLLNTGNGWATSTAYSLTPIATAQLTNGNWQGTFVHNEYGNWYGNGQMRQDVLTTVTYSKGGSASIIYAPSTQSGSNPENPTSLLLATEIGMYDGMGNAATTTYQYSGGKLYLAAGPRDRKFAGFASTTVTAPDSITKTYYNQGVSTNTTLGEQTDGYAQINHPFRKDILDLSGNLIQSNFYRWDSVPVGTTGFFANLGRQVEQDYALDGTHRDKATDYTYASTTDDLVSQIDYGEVAGNSDGTFIDTGTDQHMTTIKYAASTSANMTVPIEKSVTTAALTKVLVVGGGGGGGAGYTGNDGGAGGGAGGYLYDTAHPVAPGTYTVTVGNGGAGGSSSGVPGVSGGNSVFDTMTAIGGGGGGSSTASPNGQSGGSGGGAAYDGVAGAGTTGQGNSGGGQDHNGGSTGGGGGAGAAGGLGTSSGGGSGGTGIANPISGTLTYYAGGGGGGGNGGVGPGSGGQGGGGSGGAIGSAGSDAVANTGGGGGGGTLSGPPYTYHAGGSGGSGIVIIAYPTGTITATGGTITTSGGYTIHTFTSSGTWTVSAFGSGSGAATTTDARLYYDNLPFSQVALGNNTREEAWIKGSTYASSTKTYNSYGLVATSTDRRGYATGYKYDAFNLYVATATNPLNQKTQYLYNYAIGKPALTTDPNNRLAKNIYDGVGRLVEVDQSDTATPSILATSTIYQYTDNATPTSIVHRIDYLTATNTVDTYDFYDGLNRLVQERKATQVAGLFTATDRLYNAAGLVSSQSLPYFSSGSSFTSPTSIGQLYTTYTYDPLKRALTIGTAVGTTTNVYAKWTTTTTDPNSNVKDYTLDAYGNLASVVEHADSILTTSYTYDAANNLATTTDSLGNVRYFTYDGLGRRLSAQDLHAPGHSPFGIWYYTYDDMGNTISQVDPKGSTTTRTFDALNRLLTESNAGSTQVTDTYDSCTNGIGYLCVASSTAAKTQNTYDILGRVSNATTTINGMSYAMGYAYDREGNVSTLTYPDGSQVLYTYNLAGQLSRVQNKLSGGSWADIVSSLTYAPHGLVATVLFGNGASTTRGYNANTLYRLASLQTQGQGGTTIQNFAYTYDPVGNITQLTNNATTTNSASVTYQYDALNRLTSASSFGSTTPPVLQAFAYDALGNLQTIANSSPPSPFPVLITSSTDRFPGQSTSDSFAFNAGATSSNTVLLLMFEGPSGAPTSATYNGQSLTIHTWAGLSSYDADGYLVNPAPGTHTFTVNYPNQSNPQYRVFVLSNVDQTTPFDVDGEATAWPAGTCPKTLTTTYANDLLFADTIGNSQINPITEGSGQTELWQTQPYGAGWQWWAGATKPATSTGSQTMSFTFNVNNSGCDEVMVALKKSTASSGATTSVYAYGQTGYANPDAVTSIGNGLSTTTYAYDADGNLAQKSVGGQIFTYQWDYANRLLAVGSGGATTTFGYDAFGSRVLQSTGTTTTLYPFKWYSVASSTSAGAKYATTTSYIFNGDTLLATVDRTIVSGTATGSPLTSFIHPDHLGSTNIVTNASGTVVQALDYYPYGDIRVNAMAGQDEGRKYIGQFLDPSTGLQYLMSRYYDSARGQFTSEDPVFWGKQDLIDPQSFNTYSYSEDSPIVKKDPSGKDGELAAGAVPFIMYGAEGLGLGATVEYWGPPAAVGIITASTVALLSQGGGLVYAPSAPGFQQAVQLSQGSGYDTDPRFPINKPPGRWGGFITTTIVSAVTLGAIEEVHDRIDNMSSWSVQAQINNSYMQWACSQPTMFTSSQMQTYSDNYAYSLQTGKASNLKNSSTSSGSSGGSSGGSGSSSYMTQTYQTPNGAIVDWGGNVIVPAPSYKSKS